MTAKKKKTKAERARLVQTDMFAPPPTRVEVNEIRGEEREAVWRKEVLLVLRSASLNTYKRLGTAVCVWDLISIWKKLRADAIAQGMGMKRAWADQAFPPRLWLHVGYAHGPLDRKDVVRTYLPLAVVEGAATAESAGLPFPAKVRPDASDRAVPSASTIAPVTPPRKWAK